MITFKTKTGYSVPIKEYDKIQKKNLTEIKENQLQIKDFGKLTAYYPEVIFKNISRTNEDGSIDLIIDSGAANELNTGFLPKRSYKALRIKKEKGLLGTEKWKYIETVQLFENEIVKDFYGSLPISDIEEILEMTIKKNIHYLDHAAAI